MIKAADVARSEWMQGDILQSADMLHHKQQKAIYNAVQEITNSDTNAEHCSELVEAAKEMAKNYCGMRCGFQDHTPICICINEALTKYENAKRMD